MNRRNRWLALAAAAVAVALVVWLLTPAPVAVETGIVSRGLLVETVDEDAKTRVRDHFLLTAPLAGELQRISLHEGDEVVDGDVVARLHPLSSALLDPRTETELRRRVQAAEAALELATSRAARSQVGLAQARATVERSRIVAPLGGIPAAKLEADEFAASIAEQDLASANADVHVARHEVDIARAAVDRFHEGDRSGRPVDWELKAPIAGRVLRVQQKSGGPVAVGAPLIELGDLENLEVLIEALTEQATRIVPGAPVTLDDWGLAPVLHGRVRRIEPWGFTKISALGVEEQRVNVLVDLSSPRDDWASLGEGYHMSAHIEVYRNDHALQVPTGALFRSGSQWAAFVVSKSGRAEKRLVTVGHRTPNATEVLGGLSAGTVVVLYPSDAIDNGTRVRIAQGR